MLIDRAGNRSNRSRQNLAYRLLLAQLKVALMSSRLIQPIAKQDHVQGALDAAIVLVEYGDYGCPHCQRACGIIKQIQQQWGENLCFVFRHFPLTQLHPQSARAAEVAEAAAVQGKFWPMHDRLFEQSSLDDGSLVEAAAQLGLQMQRFLRELADRTHRDRVQADFNGGVAGGVTGTPTFFLNGVRLQESWELEPLLAAIAQAQSRPPNYL